MTNLMEDPISIDQALSQTAEKFSWAVLPLPIVEAWFRGIGEVEKKEREEGVHGFHWWRLCGLPGWDFDPVQRAGGDENGDVWLCLLRKGHEGPCPRPARRTLGLDNDGTEEIDGQL